MSKFTPLSSADRPRVLLHVSDIRGAALSLVRKQSLCSPSGLAAAFSVSRYGSVPARPPASYGPESAPGHPDSSRSSQTKRNKHNF